LWQFDAGRTCGGLADAATRVFAWIGQLALVFNRLARAATMIGMFGCRILRPSVVVAALLLLIFPLTASAQERYRGRKFKPPPPVSRITVTVLRNDNETPINNAHVIFHPVVGEKDKGGMELKTNEDGVAVMTVIPIGATVLLQVIAKGYQTYGGEYKIDKADVAMHIKMKLPGQQYSVYDNQESSNAGNGSGAGSGQQNGTQGQQSGSANNKTSGSQKQ
jgi:hypothetical protein